MFKEYLDFKNLWVDNDKLDFEVNYFNNYVYRITDIINKTHYYGSRSTKNQDMLKDLKEYASSSKRKQYIIKHTKQFKFKIIKVFDNSGDKIILESFLHMYFDVKANTKFWNEANQTPSGFDRTNIPHTSETKSLLSTLNAGTKNNNYGKRASYDTIMKKRAAWQKEIILSDGSKSTVGKEATKKYLDSLDKIMNGDTTTVRKKISQNVSKAFKRKVIFNGCEMTLKEKQTLNMTNKRKEIFYDNNGFQTTSFKEGAKKTAQTKIKNSKHYNLYHIDNGLISINLPAIEIRKISQSLIKTDPINYLGKTSSSFAALKRNNKENLVGLYVIENK